MSWVKFCCESGVVCIQWSATPLTAGRFAVLYRTSGGL